MTMTVLRAAAFAATLVLAGCASFGDDEPPGAPGRHTVVGVTDDGALLRFNAGTPRKIDARVALTGLAAGERLVGIDFRVARGVLYGLTSAGRLVTIDAAAGVVRTVGSAPPLALDGRAVGFDFNPVADRIRVVVDDGRNLRLHPDTGAVAATDPPLTRAADGAPVRGVRAAAYTYNKADDKLTTNYAIDAARGWLVVQGSVEGRAPVVSPNTGKIDDVGALGTGALDDAAFDIADVDNAALAALRRDGRTRLHRIDLATGRAHLLGTIGDGRALVGIAIEP